MRYLNVFLANGRTMPSLLIRAIVFCSFFGFATGFGILGDPPLTWNFVPGEFEVGDTIAVDVSYGDYQNPVSPTLSIQLSIPYSGFAIDPASLLTLRIVPYWFCTDGNCAGEVSIDHANKEIILLITRTNGVAVGGYGQIASVGGVGVEPEEMIGRLGNPQLDIKVYPNPASSYLVIESQAGIEIHQVELFDLMGNRVLSTSEFIPGQKVDVSSLAKQVYSLRLNTNQGMVVERLLID